MQIKSLYMITINNETPGGAIGTGLIIGTGEALVNAGPASILISYSITGLLCYSVMCALGEMATWYVSREIAASHIPKVLKRAVLIMSRLHLGYQPQEDLHRTRLV